MLRTAQLFWLCPSARIAAAKNTLEVLEKSSAILPAGLTATEIMAVDLTDPRATQYFLRVHSMLCAAIDRGSEVIVVVDEYDVAEGGLKAHSGWSALISMLVLSLPEVRWAFISVTTSRNNEVYDHFRTFLASHFGLSELRADRGSQLFDGMGLREIILNLNDIARAGSRGEKASVNAIWGETKPVAIVLDDEDQFRSMLSLAAYSWGFRVFSVSSWREALALVGPSGICLEATVHPLHRPQLSLEDLCLRYHDQPYGELDNHEERNRLLQGLEVGDLARHFVSIGDPDPGPAQSRWARKPEVQRDEIIRKPTRDYFSQWNDIEWHSARMPLDGASWHDEEMDAPHGAHGRIIMVAEAAVARAKRLLAGNPTLHEKLWVAVASSDAFRLLGGRSPMLSGEALYLRHVAEVSIVAGEVGARSRLDIQPRLDAIERSLMALAEPLPEKVQSVFVTNLRLKIVSTLEKILASSSLLYDAGRCHRVARRLRGEIAQESIRYSKEQNAIVRQLRLLSDRYFSFVLRSPESFLIATVSVFLFCVALFFIVQQNMSCQGLSTAFHHAVISFITVNLPQISTESTPVAIVSYFSSLLGLLHFGILVSLIYTYWVDRR